jgi:hypothetical protein
VTVPEPGMDDYEFKERAAIHEFDGGDSRAEAERLARADRNNRASTQSWLSRDLFGVLPPRARARDAW